MSIYRQVALSFLCLCFVVTQAYAWGRTGHRVSAKLAEEHLSPPARAAIVSILDELDLAAASTWADEMRGHPTEFWRKQAGAYHYVTVPPGSTYAETGAPAKGDAVTALQWFRDILSDESSTRAHKRMALRFSIHIVQDLHQPLHVGNGRDRGGNRHLVKFRGRRSNLHWVWDTGLPRAIGRTEAEWLAALADHPALRDFPAAQSETQTLPETKARQSDAQAPQPGMNETDPETWIAESAALRETIYPAAGAEIGADYLARHQKTIEQRLAQSARRTALYLNALFAD